MDSQTLTNLCTEWRQTLRMLDWRIVVQLVPTTDLPEKSQAHSEWNEDSQDAHIRIVVEEEYDSIKCMTAYDPEQALLHEMLHIKFWSVDATDSPAFEFAIDSTADALLTLKRGVQ